MYLLINSNIILYHIYAYQLHMTEASKSQSADDFDSASACSLQKHKNDTKQLVFCQRWKMNSNWLVKVTKAKVYTFSITNKTVIAVIL